MKSLRYPRLVFHTFPITAEPSRTENSAKPNAVQRFPFPSYSLYVKALRVAAQAPAENLPAERQMPGTDLRKCERPPPPGIGPASPLPDSGEYGHRGNHIFQRTRLVTHGISISVSRGLCSQVAYPTEAPTINPFRRKRLHAKTGNIGNSKAGTTEVYILPYGKTNSGSGQHGSKTRAATRRQLPALMSETTGGRPLNCLLYTSDAADD